MDVVTRPFDRYLAICVGGRASLDQKSIAARVSCYDGTRKVGQLLFFSRTEDIPENQLGDGDEIILTFPIERFADIGDLLRYEGPLRLVLNSSTQFGYIGTGELEPVGEQEGHPPSA